MSHPRTLKDRHRRNPQAKQGYSRDSRPDCKQVCIGLVVTKEGIPLGYEVFEGNRHDSTTVETIIEKMESLYGKSDRVWIMDRGMASVENLELLEEEGRRYIIGTSKSQLKKFEQHLLTQDWKHVHEGLEVKLCPSPDGGEETFILCRSEARREKEHAMHNRFIERLEKGLQKVQKSCASGRPKNANVIERRIGRLLERFNRASALFDIDVKERDGRTCTSPGRSTIRTATGLVSVKDIISSGQTSKTGRRRISGKHTSN